MPTSDYNELIAQIASLKIDTGSQQQQQTRLVQLKKIKSYMSRLTNEQVQRIFSDYQNVNNLFVFLVNSSNDGEEEDADEAGELLFLNESYDLIEQVFATFKSLSKLFEVLNRELLFVFTQTGGAFERIQLLSLQTFYNLANRLRISLTNHQSFEYTPLVMYLNELLPYFIQHISKANAKYSQLLAKFLCEIVQIDTVELHGRTLVLNQAAVDQFNTLLKQDSVNFFRVFELIVCLASLSPELLAECNRSFQLDQHIMAAMQQSTDILTKLNCVELLKDLGMTRHGFGYLKGLGVLDNLVMYFDERQWEADPFVELILPGIVKLFGNLAYIMPSEIFQHYKPFCNYLLKHLIDDYRVEKSTQISQVYDTLQYMCGSNEAKMVFVQTYSGGILEEKLYPQLVWYLKNSINNLQLKTLDFLSTLFSTNKVNIQLNEINSSENTRLTQNLFEKFIKIFSASGTRTSSQYTDSFMEFLLKMAKVPFMDKRLAAQNCFKSLAETNWGLSYLFSTMELGSAFEHTNIFMDYLVDRMTEHEKEGRLTKFELVQAIVQFDAINQIIDMKKLDVLNRYVRDGPYYMSRETAVAFESA